MSQIVIVHLKLVIGLLVCNVHCISLFMAFSGVWCKARVREKIRRNRGSGREFALIPYPTPPAVFPAHISASSLQMKKIITVEDSS